MSAQPPALYRTRITHVRRAPVRHTFHHRSYCWYIDIDHPPHLPLWLRPFAGFDAADHLWGPGTWRQRIDGVFAAQKLHAPDGRITALLQARVLGYVFNPLSLYWCHDRDGTLRHVIAEVHNTYGQRHAYLLSPSEQHPAAIEKAMYVSPFNDVSGHYRVHAPEPGDTAQVRISLHRDNQPTFVATVSGTRRQVSAARLLSLQIVMPVAPMIGSLAIRFQGILLWLRRVPVAPRPASGPR